MQLKFPLSDVVVSRVASARKVQNPLYADDFWQISPQEFAMQVEGVGDFFVCNGKDVEYAPYSDVTLESLELYLNGSVYGAILHQRNILPIHGSSVVWKGKGIMLCGESGAGKSSLTAAFCKKGAEFLTDDVTPVVFEEGKPFILPLSDRIKLWEDALIQLEHDKSKLTPVSTTDAKYYLPMERGDHKLFPLNRIFILEPTEVDSIETRVLQGAELFAALRNEVYRWEYLIAMEEAEAKYLGKLLNITSRVQVIAVRRPKNISIDEMSGFLAGYPDLG